MLKDISIFAVSSVVFVLIVYVFLTPVTPYHAAPNVALTDSITIPFAPPERNYYPPAD